MFASQGLTWVVDKVNCHRAGTGLHLLESLRPQHQQHSGEQSATPACRRKADRTPIPVSPAARPRAAKRMQSPRPAALMAAE